MKTVNYKWVVRYDDPPVTDIPDAPKTFTQDEVNAILAKEKREAQQRLEDYSKEFEAVKAKATLTAEEKKALETRIEALNNSLKSKEQLAEEEKAKIEKRLSTEREETAKERDYWKSQFTESSISRTLSDAALKNKAKNPKQITALIRPDTFIQEREIDGKKTGEFDILVRMTVTGEDKKPIVLELPADKAIERMSQDPEHFNLFEGTGSAGLGGTASGGTTSLKDMLGSQESYIANRGKILGVK